MTGHKLITQLNAQRFYFLCVKTRLITHFLTFYTWYFVQKDLPYFSTTYTLITPLHTHPRIPLKISLKRGIYTGCVVIIVRYFLLERKRAEVKAGQGHRRAASTSPRTDSRPLDSKSISLLADSLDFKGNTEGSESRVSSFLTGFDSLKNAMKVLTNCK